MIKQADFSWKKIFIPAFGPSLLFGIGKGAVLPIIALTAIDLNASNALSGLIVALVGLGSLVSNIPAALITARYGERRSLIGASIFSVLAIMLCLLAQRPAVLAMGVFLLGMATSVFYLARQSYMIDAVPLQLRARAFSTLGGTQRIGMLIGPFASAGFMHFMGLPGAYWMAILALTATGILSFTLPELRASRDAPTNDDPRHNPADQNALTQSANHGATRPATTSGQTRDTAVHTGKSAAARPSAKPKMWTVAQTHFRVLLSLGAGVLMIGAMRASRQIAIPLWATHIGLSPAVTAVIFGLTSAIDVLVFYPAGKIMDEYGRVWVAVPCTLLLGVSLIAIPLTSSLLPFVLACMLMGLGNGIGSGIVMTLGADAAPEHGRTQFLGLWRLIADLGSSSGPFLLSGITAWISLGTGIAAVGSLGFIAAALFWRTLPSR